MPAAVILLVDDTPLNNEILRIGLGQNGYQTLTALSAEAARDLLKESLPDLILLDILMPKVNGFEFCAELKADPRTRDIPVIFMSALHETVDKVRGFSVGGVDYVTKPFDMDEVQVRVKTHLTLYQQRLEIERLYAQASELAALHERQRIARDLHDSLSQSLFSINSIAEALPRILTKSPDRAVKYATQLAGITRSAQAEMRALLLELRPEALTGSDLADSLVQLTGIFAANSSLQVRHDLMSGIPLTAEQKTVFYRVAQEAFNNIARHAQAHFVRISLRKLPQGAELVIRDDGRGFDPDSVPGGHFGLRIMQERAESIAAVLTITTQPGAGTTVRMTL
ncbi:MAG: response regulator [Chloroflexi bacterium]|jgi:signal transduction histidine kinase|nr:MAG: putative two-component histidine kinase [Chloroflexi bacterium OLB13]MBC6956557.1 response regulator [Chloroflexota bacterium]MBV6437949.1 Regulator of RpoS [Anaerolineae bacterium]MDL1916152.1 response regulator [Anaerolineae bacterium CFX4]OQY86902.1 MAG: hypothetical protein B6D42_00245 [Anaerolineae bacterium UTCFX5]